MANSLYAEEDLLDINTDIDTELSQETDYFPSPEWDLVAGDFVLDASHRTPYADGRDAIRTWCVKAVQTHRYELMAYDEDMGIDVEDILTNDAENLIDVALERNITEALMINPRVESISNFSCTKEGDTVTVDLTVNLIDFDSFDLSTTLNIDEA